MLNIIGDELTDEESDDRESKEGAVGAPHDETRESDETEPWWSKAVTAADLGTEQFDPLTYLVDGLVIEGGVVLLSGPPKVGKSMVAASVALAVAQGGAALGGLSCRQSDVLLLSLDDASPRRMQRRLNMLSRGEPLPKGLVIGFSPIGNGPVARDRLDEYLGAHPDCGLVVVDTLEYLRPTPTSPSVYSADVAFLRTLRDVVTAHPTVTVMPLHHTRKGGEDDDAITAVGGSHGVTGGTDAVLTLSGKRGAPRRVLTIVQRDDEDSRLVLRWGDGGLAVETGMDADDPTVLMTEADAQVYRAVVEHGDAVTAVQLQPVLDGMPNVGNRLLALTKAGHLRKVGRGRYEA